MFTKIKSTNNKTKISLNLKFKELLHVFEYFHVLARYHVCVAC